MKKLVILAVGSLLIAAIGCNKEPEPAANTNPSGTTQPVETKTGAGANAAGQISPGPGIGQAETRAGSATGGK